MTKPFDTQIVPATDEHLAKAAAYLKAGEVVGMPTETVYGLAANATDPAAIRKIFIAKGRPQDNPLIVHLAQTEQMADLVREIPKAAKLLADAFWPGPLTIILPKSARIPSETTGGLDTVAIRIPAHPIARALITACGFPLAAPSANLSGSPSPTTAAHVLADMAGRIPIIIDGGASTVGVESTVVMVSDDTVKLLRPGGITVEMLKNILPSVEIDNGVLHAVAEDTVAASPGMKYKHYAPKANVLLIESSIEQFRSYLNQHAKAGDYALVFEGEEQDLPIPALTYGKKEDPDTQAKALFAALRRIDECSARTVYARCPDKEGMGLAVYNRLIRAAGFQVLSLGD